MAPRAEPFANCCVRDSEQVQEGEKRERKKGRRALSSSWSGSGIFVCFCFAVSPPLSTSRLLICTSCHLLFMRSVSLPLSLSCKRRSIAAPLLSVGTGSVHLVYVWTRLLRLQSYGSRLTLREMSDL